MTCRENAIKRVEELQVRGTLKGGYRSYIGIMEKKWILLYNGFMV